MKKQVSAILAASMAASMLVACGGSTSSAATSTAPAESTSTASSEAAPAESTADAGQAADITLWTYPIGDWGKPEVVSEDEMTLLAREIAQRIENELEYPGQIKVHLLREVKIVEYAK